MTNQTNHATALSPKFAKYKHAHGEGYDDTALYTLALANDALAGFVLAGCPDDMVPSLMIALPEITDFWMDVKNLDMGADEGMEDAWSELEYQIIQEEAPDHESFGRDPWCATFASELKMFDARIKAVSAAISADIQKESA